MGMRIGGGTAREVLEVVIVNKGSDELVIVEFKKRANLVSIALIGRVIQKGPRLACFVACAQKKPK
jgi:hypothetical protein